MKQAAKIIRDAVIRSEHIIKYSQLDAKHLVMEM
jgi:hypothetical protein